MKKLTNFFYNSACIGIVLGLLYFFYHVAIQGNWWQSLASFFIGATIGALIVALLAAVGRSEDGSYYEAALIDCNTNLKTAENNYDLMRLANQSLQKDKDILTADVNRQAEIIAELVTKHNKLYLENDALKANNVRTGGLSIDSDGKIV